MGRTGEFTPGDQLDVLLLKQLAELGAGEEIEIALAPSGAQVSRSRVAAFISSSANATWITEFGDAGLKIFEGSFVELGPFFKRNAGAMVTVWSRTISAGVKLDSK